ncbi:MAG: FAD-dependent oxidoreductase, partial [Pseudomonadota bacterium]|nr:FAD-dependent oxidoreductase [Pseudomonadota bacterium]
MLGKRQSLDALADENWDLVVIGGGITGAGVLLEAARRGLRVLLLEQTDFAWGTSSRSSKMVHGGLRYIAQGDIRLTRHSLLERERLIDELPGLVERATYLFPLRKGVFPGRWPMKAILWLYDFLAGIRDHRYLSREQLLERVPGLNRQSLTGAMSYTDALTDDCRLVVRAILEAAR